MQKGGRKTLNKKTGSGEHNVVHDNLYSVFLVSVLGVHVYQFIIKM